MKCDSCGNEYEKCFEILTVDRRYVFDCFECAINTLAPHCAQCGTKIIGHGVEAEGKIYCCSSCVRLFVRSDAIHSAAS